MEQDSAYDSPRSADLSLSPLSPHSLINKSTSLCSIACPSCKKTFVDPRVLPCLHTYCFPCLEANSCKARKKVICPECHMDFCLPANGIQGLIPDYGIVSFIKSLKGHLFCSSCKISDVPCKTAVAKCINCDNFLCQSCVNAHNYMYCFEGHKVIEFPKDFLAIDSEKASSSEISEEMQLHCLLHPNCQITHFCFMCNEPVCSTCVIESHPGHRADPLDQAGDSLIASMNHAMDENRSRLTELGITLRSAKRMDNYLRSQYLDISQKINDTYTLYNSTLHKHRQQQMTILEQLYFKAKAAVQNHVNVYQDTFEKTSKVADFHSRLIKYGSTAQILMFKKMLEDKRFPMFKPKPISCSLKFISEPCDYSALLYRSFGHVASEMNAGPEPDFSRDWLSSGGALFKYDRWSASCMDDMKFTELGISDELMSPIPRSYSLKSSVTRQVITYTHKFGRYGSSHGEFTEPNGVAINSEGDIIIADTNNNRVQIFDKLGTYKYHFGEGSKTKDTGNLLFPNRVAVMAKTGDIVVTERAPTHQVQLYNQYGQFIRRFGANILQHPRAVAVDGQGRIIVVECKVMRVIIFDQSGEILNKFNCSQTLHFPNGVAVNDRQQIFISDNRIHCVVVYDYNGTLIRTIGQEGVTNYPIGVMLNRKGQVIVADNHNNFNLTVFTQDGQFVAAVESKVKHAQCFDADISNEGSVVLTSKDYKVYIYQTNF